MIFIRRSGMEDVLVGEPLNVADVEDHVQAEAHASFFQYGEGGLLGGGEGWDPAGVGEAGEGADEVGVPSALSKSWLEEGMRGKGGVGG